MKKLPIFACLFASYASGAPLDGTKLIYEKNPHHAYIGPDVFFFDFQSQVDCIRVEGQRVFTGLKAGYEYLKEGAFYGGVEIVGTGAAGSFAGYWDDCWIQPSVCSSWFVKGDARVGYTFGITDALFSPFVGLGGYGFGNGGEFHQSAFFVEGGLRSQYGISPFFDLGLNLQLFYADNVQQKFSYSVIECMKSKEVWGGEIALPFTWHVHTTKQIDIRFEPYFTKLDFLETQDIYGARLLFGYRF